ncbi:uncharacterized protein LOC126737982 [Anthonomus grandis grandis]|uniref:uncharacterized protein LOC126737982 n=1 Tax=Anthonomus grandis grandis TaxID=2921223 RepID=UPI00216645E5|nr:uncharacterized protein LOC126737982 [Anthonomus grandis grandis]XP_050299087.1 uncharacterized protein LOC126737982 [Anthonomus grandis grandis]
MPKVFPKKRSKSKRGLAGQLKVIKNMLSRLERKINSEEESDSSLSDVSSIQSEKPSSYSSQSEEMEEGENSPSAPNEIGANNIQVPAVPIAAEDSLSVIHLLKEHPNTESILGPDVHEEIAVRWLAYLKDGLPTETRKELLQKYKLPNNCKTLTPPLINDEIKSLLPTKNIKNDQFLVNIQGQIGASLAALGSILSEKLKDPNKELIISNENLEKIVDACQLMANTHYTLTLKRKFEISPHLNEEGRRAASENKSDEFLFGKDFLIKVRSSKEVKKAAEELFNQKKVNPVVAGPSGINNNRLNYQRQYSRGKTKEDRKTPYTRSGKTQATRRYQNEKQTRSQDRHQFYKKDQRKTSSRYQK